MKNKSSLDIVLAPCLSENQVVSCDGGSGPLGHPKVFLKIPQETKQIECPYCSRPFIYKPE